MELELDCLMSICTKVCASSRLVSQVHIHDVMAGQNIKQKYLIVSDPSQNVETTYNSKLKFTSLKDLFIKRVQKNWSKKIYMYDVAT